MQRKSYNAAVFYEESALLLSNERQNMLDNIERIISRLKAYQDDINTEEDSFITPLCAEYYDALHVLIKDLTVGRHYSFANEDNSCTASDYPTILSEDDARELLSCLEAINTLIDSPLTVAHAEALLERANQLHDRREQFPLLADQNSQLKSSCISVAKAALGLGAVGSGMYLMAQPAADDEHRGLVLLGLWLAGCGLVSLVHSVVKACAPLEKGTASLLGHFGTFAEAAVNYTKEIAPSETETPAILPESATP